jgi:hypothetical protein
LHNAKFLYIAVRWHLNGCDVIQLIADFALGSVRVLFE